MRNFLHTAISLVGKKSSYAGIIIVTAFLVQLVIDMIYLNQY